MQSKIEIKCLSYVYGINTPFEKRALNNITLEIEKGITTGLIGHTGSGKSTLALILSGLLKPTEGSIFIDGAEIYGTEKKKNRAGLNKMRFKTGIIFQYPEYQLFEETVYKDIAYGPTNMGLSEDEIRKRVHDAAGFANIESDCLEKSPFELSGGQKRRVAIAGVIAMDPEILILDEPAAGLDPRGREEILGGLFEYQKITGKTMIMISHSMEDMAKYADKIIVLKKSELYMYDEVGSVFSHTEELKQSGLSIPQISDLFLELRSRGIPVNTAIYKMERAVDEIMRIL